MTFSPVLIEALRKATRVTVLTGAGVSVESGLTTYRGPNGEWANVRIEDVANPHAWKENPRRVWDWYDGRRQMMAAAKPNPAHEVIARLQDLVPDFNLITQNVDGLHQRAGSEHFIELHGDVWHVRCEREGECAETRGQPLLCLTTPLLNLPPRCVCGANQRPCVVWFGEGLDPNGLMMAMANARDAEVFLSIGTSGVVSPASHLIHQCKDAGGTTVEINPEATASSGFSRFKLRGPAGEILPALEAAVWGAEAIDQAENRRIARIAAWG